jgi:hypothetical protein
MLIAGGMCRGRSMMDLAMIDVNTWEWLPLPAFDPSSELPSRRYGCTLSPFALPSSAPMAYRRVLPTLVHTCLSCMTLYSEPIELERRELC